MDIAKNKVTEFLYVTLKSETKNFGKNNDKH